MLGVAAGGLIVVTTTQTIVEALGATEAQNWTATGGVALAWLAGIVWAVRQEGSVLGDPTAVRREGDRVTA